MVRQLTILIVILIGGWSSSYGQENPTAKQDLVQQALENPHDESDSSVNVSMRKRDSIQVLQKIDTLQKGISKINSASGKIEHKLDSIDPGNHVQYVNSKIDVFNNSINSKLDSIQSLNLGGGRISDKVDSFKIKLDTLKSKGAFRKARRAKSKVENTGKKINDAESKINDKLGIFKRESEGVGTMPGTVDIPDNGGLNGSVLPGTNPDVNLNTENQTDKLGSLGGGNKGAIPGVSGLQLNNLEEIEKINDVKDKIGEVSEITEKAGEYGKDLKNIEGGDVGEIKAIPKELENRVSDVNEIRGLKTEMGVADKSMKDLEKLKDPEEARKIAMEKAAKEATNYFAGHDEGLSKAMANMNKYKKKYPNLQSTKDLPKHKPNEMKSRPFIERIVPFSTFQIQLMENLLLDINPGVTYRWTGRFSVGLGWNERIGMNISENRYFIKKDRIFGPRSFAQFRVKENYHLRMEYEIMNAVVPPNYFSQDVGTRQWISSWFVGVKKDFKFTKNIKGNVQFSYNLFDRYHLSPYMDRINARFGIEIPLKKKVKEEDLSSQ